MTFCFKVRKNWEGWIFGGLRTGLHCFHTLNGGGAICFHASLAIPLNTGGGQDNLGRVQFLGDQGKE